MQVRSIDCGSGWLGWERLFLGSLFLDLRLFLMNYWIGVNGLLGSLIREVDGTRLGCDLSGVIGIAGDRTAGELTPESLLVLLTRFWGAVTGAVRKGSIGDERESSMQGCSELFNFWIRCPMNLSWKLSWRRSIGTYSSIFGSRVSSLG